MKGKAWLVSFAGIIAIFLTVLFSIAANQSFYDKYYAQTDLAAQVQASPEDLSAAMSQMLGFLKDGTPMEGEITWKGHVQEAFNAKEKAHMEDVRQLYLGAEAVQLVCLAIALAGTAWFVWKKKTDVLAQGYLEALGCFVLLLAVLALWMATGFTDFWTHFHQLFFSNDLWLLNPATDFMIVICPENLFFILAFLIAGVSFVILAGLGWLAWKKSGWRCTFSFPRL